MSSIKSESADSPGGRIAEPWLGIRGSTAVLTALLLPVMIGFVGLGLDTANWYSNHRLMERIADSAALAAAPYLSSEMNSTAMITAIAQNDAVLAGLSTTGTDTIAVTIASDRSSVSVTATRRLTRFFSALFLSSDPSTNASAQAGSPTYPVCMLVQATKGNGVLSVQNGSSLSAPNCEIDVASTSPTAAKFDGSLTQVGKICVAGGSTVTGNSTVNNLSTNCTPVSDPYSGTITAPTVGSCLVNGKNYGPGTVNLSPGVYCGNFNWSGPGTLNFAPGLYIFASGVNFTISTNFNINGSGVTFYFVDSGSYIDFAGSTVTLTAPTTGTYANILMFEAPGLSAGVSGCTGDGCFNLTGGATGNTLTGVIDLPSRNLLLASGVLNATLTLVANTLTFYSTMAWSVNPSAISISKASSTTSVLLQ